MMYTNAVELVLGINHNLTIKECPLIIRNSNGFADVKSVFSIVGLYYVTG